MDTVPTLDRTAPAHPPRPPARVTLVDRAAMRLGLALLMWGRRRRRRTPPTPGLVAEQRRLRAQYELDAAHAALARIQMMR